MDGIREEIGRSCDGACMLSDIYNGTSTVHFRLLSSFLRHVTSILLRSILTIRSSNLSGQTYTSLSDNTYLNSEYADISPLHSTLRLHRTTRIIPQISLSPPQPPTHTELMHNVLTPTPLTPPYFNPILLPLPRLHLLRHQNPQGRPGRGLPLVSCSLRGLPYRAIMYLFHSTTPTNACSASAFRPPPLSFCCMLRSTSQLIRPYR
jgi:hypothetical protein